MKDKYLIIRIQIINGNYSVLFFYFLTSRNTSSATSIPKAAKVLFHFYLKFILNLIKPNPPLPSSAFVYFNNRKTSAIQGQIRGAFGRAKEEKWITKTMGVVKSLCELHP